MVYIQLVYIYTHHAMPYHLQKRRQRHSKQTLAMAFRLSASGAPAPSEARFFVASTWSIAPFFFGHVNPFHAMDKNRKT